MSSTDLGTLIAAWMRPNYDLTERLRRVGVSPSDLLAAKEWGRAQGLLRGATDRHFRNLFGDPLIAANGFMSYSLPPWPEHLFDVGVSSDNQIFYQGFRLRSEYSNDFTHGPWKTMEAAEVLRVGWHTEHDIQGLLGRPAQTYIWRPLEDWFYGPLPNELYLTFALDFGLLSGICLQSYLALPE